MAETSGEISKYYCYLEWSIPNFFSQFEKSGEFCSPEFLAGPDTWTISICPVSDTPVANVSFLLKRLTTNGNKFVNFTLSIKTIDGLRYNIQRKRLFSENENVWGWSDSVQRSGILNEESVAYPGHVLTISCTICSEHCASEPIWDTSKPEYISAGGPSAGPNILWESLSSNLKDLFLSHTKTDTIIKVRGEEFPVHRMILSARSTVFAEMFEQNMEKNLVEIPHAIPAIIRDLLLFMYSGEIKTLTLENVYDLYALSNIYKLEELKKECSTFVDCPPSVDTDDVSLLVKKYYPSSKFGYFCIIL